jgi:hypothetical protein
MRLNGTKTKSKSELESAFQKECKELIEMMGGYVIKVHVSAYQSQGEPDLVCCFKGRFVAFELKIDGNKPSALQQEKIEDIKRAGGIALPVYSINEIKEILYELSRIQQGGEPQE